MTEPTIEKMHALKLYAMTSAWIAQRAEELRGQPLSAGRLDVEVAPEVGGRLEEMASFAKYVGGCPTNISIGTARLGLKPGLITGVGDEHMGRFIKEQAAAEGELAAIRRRHALVMARFAARIAPELAGAAGLRVITARTWTGCSSTIPRGRPPTSTPGNTCPLTAAPPTWSARSSTHTDRPARPR